MLNQPTIEKLQVMKLHGMVNAFQEQIESAEINQLSFEERFGLSWTANGRGKKVEHSRDGCNWPNSKNVR
jgi:hypothetical protein